MSYKLLTIASDDGVASLSFNRPESGNALSVELMQEIITACNSYKYDTDTRVIVFRGEDLFFSSDNLNFLASIQILIFM